MATHIAILGAGPAGSAAAYHLARAGLDVTLIEARPFPRLKVCGEYISPAATPLLEALISAQELAAAGAHRVPHMTLEAGDQRTTWNSPAPAWALSRAALDSLLLEKSRAAGVTVLQPATVRRVGYSDASVTVELSTGGHVCCDLVVHADGSGRNDPAGAVPLAPDLIAHKCHLRIPDAGGDTVVMRSCPGAYIGTIAVEEGQHTCALVARRGLTARFRNVDALVGHLWPDYRRAWRTSPWKSCGVPRSRFIAPGHHRSFRIGNAAAAVDPVGGEGIGLALWSAAQLGNHSHQLAEFATRPKQGAAAPILATIHDQLRTAYAERLRLRLPACRFTAWLLIHPAIVRCVWPLADAPNLSFLPFYRLTGKATPASP